MEKKIYSRPYAAEECFTPNQYVASCEEPAKGLSFVCYWDPLTKNDGLVRDGNADDYCMVTKEHIEAKGKLAYSGQSHIGYGWYFNKTIYNRIGSESDQPFTPSYFSVVDGYENATVYIGPAHYAYIFKERPSQDIIDKGTNYNPNDPTQKTMS